MGHPTQKEWHLHNLHAQGAWISCETRPGRKCLAMFLKYEKFGHDLPSMLKKKTEDHL